MAWLVGTAVVLEVRVADMGAKGQVSPVSRRWGAPRGVYPARIDVPEPIFRVQKPNRAVAWAKYRAKAKAKAGVLRRPAGYTGSGATAKAGAKAKAKPKARLAIRAVAKTKAQPKAKEPELYTVLNCVSKYGLRKFKTT